MSKSILLSILTLFFSSIVFAQADLKLTQEEFLKKLMDGQITMKKDPLMPLAENTRAKVMENFRRTYPTFKDAYWFVPNLRTNNYLYTVFFEWPTRKCLFRIEELDKQSREVKKESIDPSGKSIDLKYCEKAYGMKIN